MVKWECQMFYKDRLYSGHYARKKVVELQRYHPAMRFVLTDWQKGSIIDLHKHTKELA
jgi:hypothetical protein